MYLQVKLTWNVILPPSSLYADPLMREKAMLVRLLNDFAEKKATKDHGYLLAVTTRESIGEGRVRQNTGEVLFPVIFSAITFKIFSGEILFATVTRVLKQGVFLRSGPVETLYLSSRKMTDYNYVAGEDAYFMNGTDSKIRKGDVVRCIVIATKWLDVEREIQALVSIEGDYLGPIQDSDSKILSLTS